MLKDSLEVPSEDVQPLGMGPAQRYAADNRKRVSYIVTITSRQDRHARDS